MHRVLRRIALMALVAGVAGGAVGGHAGVVAGSPVEQPEPPAVPDLIEGAWQNAETEGGAIVVTPTTGKGSFEGLLSLQTKLVPGCYVDKSKSRQVWRITKYRGSYLGGFVCHPSRPAWPASWEIRRTGDDETLVFFTRDLATGSVYTVRLTHPEPRVKYAFRQHGPDFGSVWNTGQGANTSTGGDVALAIKLYGESSTSGSGALELETVIEKSGGKIVHDDHRPILGDLELELRVVGARTNYDGWNPEFPDRHPRELVLDVVVTKSNDPKCPRLQRGVVFLYDETHPVRIQGGKSTLWPGEEVTLMLCEQRHAHQWIDLSEWDSQHLTSVGVTIKGPSYLWP